MTIKTKKLSQPITIGMNLLLCLSLILAFFAGTAQSFSVASAASARAKNLSNENASQNNHQAANLTGDTIIYGANGYNFSDLFRINLTQGTSEWLGKLLFSTQAIEQDPETGYLYYYEWQRTGDEFAYWDPATGSHTIVRVYNPSPRIYIKRMAFHPDGRLFMMDNNDRLYTINKHNGDITSLGKTSGLETGDQGATGDMAFAPDGTLYVATYQSLYTLNLANRVATRLYSNMIAGDGITVWSGLAYCNSLLYASSIEESQGTSLVYRIHPGTGQVDFLFHNPTVLNDLSSCPTSSSPPPNQAPQAHDQALTTPVNTPLAITLTATDPEGAPLSFSVIDTPANGALSGTVPNLTYTPNAGFSGSDSFTFRASDGAQDSNLATITISVTAVNAAPVAQDDAYSTPAGTPLNVGAPGVLANDSDPDGDPLVAILDSGTTNGSLALNPDGAFSYTPNAGFSGSDSFTYRASDGALTSNLATVTLTVTAVNAAPVAQDDAYSTPAGTPLNVGAPGVLANDSDPNGDPLAAALASSTTNGSLTLNANGSFSYTPNAGFSGSDSFTYRASDGALTSNLATVTLTINPSGGDTIIYGANAYNHNQLYEINLTQGSSRVIASLLFGTLAIEQDPGSGYVYYLEWKRSFTRFAYWNPATGTSNVVRVYNPSPGFNASRMAFHPNGTLYVMDDRDRLYTINKHTGDITSLGRTTGLETGEYGGTGDMAFAPDGTLYVVTYTSLYTLNIATRQATLLYTNMIGGADIIVWSGLAYCNNLLYASDIENYAGVDYTAIFRINPGTGQTDKLFYTAPQYLNDLSSCPASASTASSQMAEALYTGFVTSASEPIFQRTQLSEDALSEAFRKDTTAGSGGFGVMGDSNSDEYRADDNRGGQYAATTLNWVEQLVLRRSLNFGPWGEWDKPRRTGYKYNWARSGATAASLITTGQHTGLAQQVANGEVSHAVLHIGANDFHLVNGTYAEIYNGSLSGAALQAKIDAILANITLATDTILDSGSVNLVLYTISDPGSTPFALEYYPDPIGRQRVTDAIFATNARITAMAAARGLPVADPVQFSASIAGRVDENGYLNVGGELITMVERGNEPHHMQLDDSTGHVGTVMSGLMANALFIQTFNDHYGLGIPPMSDQEILENAGIKPPPTPDIITYTAEPQSGGTSYKLSWEARSVLTLRMDNGIGYVTNVGSLIVTPGQNKIYTLTGQGPGGTANASLDVRKNNYPGSAKRLFIPLIHR